MKISKVPSPGRVAGLPHDGVPWRCESVRGANAREKGIAAELSRWHSIATDLQQQWYDLCGPVLHLAIGSPVHIPLLSMGRVESSQVGSRPGRTDDRATK